MKNGFSGIAASLCLVLCVSFAFAGEEVVPYDTSAAAAPAPASPCCFLKPSFSAGFSEAGEAHYQFNMAPSIGGVASLNLRTPAFPGFYLAGDLPYALTDRLKLTLGARWAPGYNDGQGRDNFNDITGLGRNWDSGDSDWVTADLLASYVLAKDRAFVKDFSVAGGFRYDYHHIGLSGPSSPVGVLSGPSDTTGLTTQTWGPVAGFTATFPGYKCGIYGGDIKLGVFGSPVAWGNVDFREKFGGIDTLAVKGNLDACQTEFYSLSAEATAVSWKVCPGLQATVSLFADFTMFYGGGNLAGQLSETGVPIIETSKVGFKMSPDVVAAGFKVVLAF